MRAEDLLDAIGNIDDDLIENTQKETKKSHTHWFSLAATFLLVIGLGSFGWKYLQAPIHNMFCTLMTSEVEPTTATQSDNQSEPTTTEPSVTAPTMEYKVAMVTDYGDITDQSFNQTTYEACVAFTNAAGIDFQYYKPQTNDTAGRIAMTELAIAEGHNIIVMPGSTFGATLVDVAPRYPDVKFIATDVAKGDLLETAVTLSGKSYDNNPENWNLSSYFDMSNVYCATFEEEVCGYMVGYAVVKLGYTKLGFIGGMETPIVQRFGYGYVQGADDAAGELGIKVDLKYIYSGQFYGDADITAVMDTWYADGTQAVFACGGGVYTSVAEAAQKVGGKVIGAERDQSQIIDGLYGEGITITSAMKGIYPALIDTLTDVIINDNWADYAGQIRSFGLVDSTDPEAHYVQIPYQTTQWNEGFTQEEYRALLENLSSGHVTVSEDISQMPATSHITLQYFGSIKGQ